MVQPRLDLSASDRAALENVLDILFPDEPDGVGAASVGVIDYINTVLAGRHADLVPVYRFGISWLHEQARHRGAGSFDTLDRASQEAIVDGVMTRCTAEAVLLDPLLLGAKDGAGAGSAGDELLFFTALWRHTREGLFGDPQNGGNRDGAMWAWMGYSGPQLNGYTDSEILENQTPRRPLRFARDWRNHRG